MGKNRKKRSFEDDEKIGESSKNVIKRNSKFKKRQIGSFTVLEINYKNCKHYSYMRAHDGEDDKTLFLVNLPIDSTEKHVKRLFEDAGIIQTVKLWKGKEKLQDEDDTRTGAPEVISLGISEFPFLTTATSAHITFLDSSSLQKALTLTNVTWPEMENEVGLQYLISRYKSLRPDLDKVRIHADSVIARFEWDLKHPKPKISGIQVASIGENGELLDKDGFTIVQSSGKYGRTLDQQGGSIKIGKNVQKEDEQPAKKKKRSIELDDFYRFQRREAKRQELAQLRLDFQSDQEKIKKLKQSKRGSFKPF